MSVFVGFAAASLRSPCAASSPSIVVTLVLLCAEALRATQARSRAMLAG